MLGAAASLLKALHVSRNHHGHAEVTSAFLYVLMYKAYNAYTVGVDEGEEPKSFNFIRMPVNRYRHGIFFLQHLCARWLSVHIRDFECVETEIPTIAAEFREQLF